MTTTLPASITPSATTADDLSGALLIDVRTPGEFSRVHIDSSFNLPLDGLRADRVEALVKEHPDRPVVLLCQSGMRTREAATRLRKEGFGQASVLEGGIAAWQAAGLPVVRGSGVIPIDRQVQLTVGLMILAGLLLAWRFDPAWLVLPAIAGFGLTLAGAVGVCPLALLVRRMPWNRGGSCATTGCCAGS